MPDQIVRMLRSLAGPSGRRLSVEWPAELRFWRMRRACTVLDISCGGASISADGVPQGVRDLRLLLSAGPPIAASLAWRQQNRIGLRFDAVHEWVLEIGGRRYDPAAWVR